MPTAAELLASAIATDNPDARSLLLHHARLADLRERITACTDCDLHATCHAPVPWEGGPAPIAIIGEAPGAEEDQAGRPFVGRAGRLLTSLLAQAGLGRDRVVLINSIACRPPHNDFNLAVQADAPARCAHWLTEQIEVSGAWVLVPVGGRPYHALMPESNIGITQARGTPKWKGRHLIFPTFHPAYALRNPEAKTSIVEDLIAVRKIIEGVESVQPPKSYDPERLISAIRPINLTESEAKAFKSQWAKKGWVSAWSAFVEDTVVLVRDEQVKVPDGIDGVRYAVHELAILAAMGERRWADAWRLHMVKKMLGAVVVGG